ncbi:hypothetical protein EZ313_12665 [Ramlibacter henchirensis]|uniref:Outer membrane protein beta-barrel domain-containing protein n=1 Tax=Ramlibacter henchirensis TaxID=204072 RepID=A0A4Z0C946_9BURK|nr:outer membrane beta-barrel protein [Ramlibacter henchirensis]TFZ07412.1 hypothetical protein EZ313_12665 [Ramlibacter henchirensis]
MEPVRIVRQSPALFALALLLSLVLGNAHGQLIHRGPDPWEPRPAVFMPGLGLQVSRVQYPIGCGASLLRCDANQAAALAAGARAPLHWKLEFTQLSLGPADRLALGPTRQGLNLSLVGRRPLFGSAFSVYGKLGATYGYADATSSPVAASPALLEHGYGFSFGAGLSMEISQGLSATLGWDSHEMRLGGSRDGFHSTSIGLQYRY